MSDLPNIFLAAYYDPVAALKCSSPTLSLADVAGDGDYRLVAADLGQQKLRVYRGTGLSSTHALLGEPVGLVAFYPDASLPRTPSLAVASGNAVYVYRHLRPYLKFTLPSLPMSTQEQQVWDTLKKEGGSGGVGVAARRLGELRDEGVRLTSRAQDLLALPGSGERAALLESFQSKPFMQHTVVTALGAINRSREGEGEVSCLVVATEAKQVLFLDAVGSSVTATVDLPATATHMVTWGAAEGEHRIYVAARDGVVYAIKDRKLMPTRVEPPTLPVAIVRAGGALVVAGMDHTLTAFPPSGSTEILWSTGPFPAPITCLARLAVGAGTGATAAGGSGPAMASTAAPAGGGGGGSSSSSGGNTMELVVVGLEGGEVGIFKGPVKVAGFTAPDTVLGMAFGRYGREGNTLVLSLRSGGVAFHVLRRTAMATLATSIAAAAAGGGGARGGSLPEVDIPLPIPKKTRLALEQGAREKECGVEMHRVFQKGLMRLRLATAREYLKVLVSQGGAAALSALEQQQGGGGAAVGGLKGTQKQQQQQQQQQKEGGGAVGALASSSSTPMPPSLRVTCDVLGLGPSFTLRVTVTNAGKGEAHNIALVAACGAGTGSGGGSGGGGAFSSSYFLPHHLRLLPPTLLPGMEVVEDLVVDCLDVEAPPGEVLVHLIHVPSPSGGSPLSQGGVQGTRPLVTAAVAMPVSSP